MNQAITLLLGLFAFLGLIFPIKAAFADMGLQL